MQAYCVKCRKTREMMSPKKVSFTMKKKSKGGKTMKKRSRMVGTCSTCGTKMSLFVK